MAAGPADEGRRFCVGQYVGLLVFAECGGLRRDDMQQLARQCEVACLNKWLAPMRQCERVVYYANTNCRRSASTYMGDDARHAAVRKAPSGDNQPATAV